MEHHDRSSGPACPIYHVGSDGPASLMEDHDRSDGPAWPMNQVRRTGLTDGPCKVRRLVWCWSVMSVCVRVETGWWTTAHRRHHSCAVNWWVLRKKQRRCLFFCVFLVLLQCCLRPHTILSVNHSQPASLVVLQPNQLDWEFWPMFRAFISSLCFYLLLHVCAALSISVKNTHIHIASWSVQIKMNWAG